MKKILLLFMLTLILIIVGCSNGNNGETAGDNQPANADNEQAASNNEPPADDAEPLRAILVLPEKIGVNPFFALMDEGAKQAADEFGVELSVVEATDPNAIEENLRIAVAEGYDLIMTATFQAEDALTKVATENPDKQFAIIDTVLDLPNVRSAVFKEHEAAYLMGAAAGLSTQTNKVGMVVAMDIPLLKKYTDGFTEGLKSVNADAEVLINYVGSFEDPAQAKELALLQYSQGADFVSGMAAVGDLGVFEAAKEQGLYTSGQDVDRTVIDPEHIVLSQIKGTDAVAYETIKAFAEGTFSPGAIDYGLAEGGVGVTFITHESPSPLSPFIGQETVDQVKAIYEQIKSGDIVVTNPLQ